MFSRIALLTALFSLAYNPAVATHNVTGLEPAGGEATFCPPNTTLATIGFDYNRNWTPVLHGEFVDNLGFGFTMKIREGANCAGQEVGLPKIFNSFNDHNDTMPALQGLDMGLGNLLVPGSFECGGMIIFNFHSKKASLYSVQLVDTADHKSRLVLVQGRNREKVYPRPTEDVTEFILKQHGVRRFRVRFFQPAGIGFLKMCIPEPRVCSTVEMTNY